MQQDQDSRASRTLECLQVIKSWLLSVFIYLFIKYHHVNVSQGRIVRIFFLPFFHPFQPRPLGVAVVQTMSLRQAAGKNTAVFEHSNEF